MQIQIRRATVEDSEAAAWCHLLCWREAYAELVPADQLLDRTSDIDRRIERWTTAAENGWVRWLALNPDPAAAVEDRVVGFASGGPNRDDDAPTPLELQSIYTRQKWWGTGLGARLLEIAIGKDPASLWVFEDNDRARTLYERAGFRPEGVRLVDPRWRAPQVRYLRPAPR